jgi:hypothetical protein
VRRLTRIDTRSLEQIVDLDGTDDVAVEVGHWVLLDAQAAQLREFLLRGGFLMADHFHGVASLCFISRTILLRRVNERTNGKNAFFFRRSLALSLCL